MTTVDPTLAADIDAACRLTGSVTLRSGRVATEYFDKYMFESDPHLLARVARQMAPLVPRTTELAEGPQVAGRRVTLVEDVVTTGGAVRDATVALRAAGAVVSTVVCAIDRSLGGVSSLTNLDLEVRPAMTKAQLDATRA